jgi:hypothetical protein|uniref:Uncharacterized protein n=1 Tax=viral metagenome TaxID=1070528 RepID=A0A6C0D9N1_9ZZZZ
MSALGAFCNQLIAFVEDLAETYPEEKDLLMGVQAMKLMKQANPRMLHRLFAEYVNPTVQERILVEDDAYVIDNAKAIFDSQYSDMLTLFWVFKKHWTSMSETNKQHIWKYLKSLVLLARRVPDTLA